MQLYLYEDPADACSGFWEYNPWPETVDMFTDALIADRAAIDAAMHNSTQVG